jgi:hypothetical protein
VSGGRTVSESGLLHERCDRVSSIADQEDGIRCVADEWPYTLHMS